MTDPLPCTPARRIVNGTLRTTPSISAENLYPFRSAWRTIVRTGVKTGASIRDALVLVGGAFRSKVLRF